MTEQKQAIFLKAYEPCHDRFIRYCSALTFAKMDTEDLVQDVLLSAYEHFDKIKRKDQLLHYLIRAARNRSISRWRRSKTKTELLEQHAHKLIARGTPPEQLVDIQILYRQLNRLPEKQRDAIMLFEISGFSIKEIAKIQNSSENAVKTRLSRGRKKLRRTMEERPISRLWLAVLGVDYPTLNKEALTGMIQHPPTLSLIKSYQLLNLNLNPVIMSSIIAPLLIASMILVMPNNAPKNATTLTASIASPKILDTIVKPLAALQPKQKETSTETPAKKQLAIKSKKVDDFALEELRSTDTLFKPVLPSQATEDRSLFRITTDTSNSILATPEGTNVPSASIFDPPTIIESNCKRSLRFTGKANSLKKTLLNNLKKDQLITSRKAGMLLTFDENEKIHINQEVIPDGLQGKYKMLLGGYGILPCPIRIVEITRQYIAVGDITSDGFTGHTTGTVILDQLGKD